MLGVILGSLTNPRVAEEALAQLADAALRARVEAGAAAAGLDIGTFVASTVRQTLEHTDETVWLAVVGRMSNTAEPGLTALQAVLARAFPPPTGTGTGTKPPRTVVRHSG